MFLRSRKLAGAKTVREQFRQAVHSMVTSNIRHQDTHLRPELVEYLTAGTTGRAAVLCDDRNSGELAFPITDGL